MTEDGPLLTVVLTSYNYAHYVADALDALVPQLRPEVRLLVIDDGSTDNSLDLLLPYVEGNDCITVVRNEVNKGIHAVLNQGLALVHSPWILYSAMDDKVYPELTARMLPLLSRYPHVGLCTAPADYLSAEGTRLSAWMGPILRDDAYYPPEAVAQLMHKHGFWFAGMTTVLSVKALREAGGFQKSLGHMADSFVSQELALRYGMCTIAAPMAGVRQLPDSYSQRDAEDLRAAETICSLALERMRSRHALFPESFRRDWAAFNRSWSCLRTWKHGPHQSWRRWRDAALAAEGGLFSKGMLRLTICGQWAQMSFLGLFALAKLWNNALFWTRLRKRLRSVT